MLMTLDILFTGLLDFRATSVGAVCKNVFYKKSPDGGARGGPCETSGLAVVIWHPRSVCVQR